MFTGTLRFEVPFGVIDGMSFASTANAVYSAAELQDLDPAQPLAGELPWDDADSWVDVYAYSTPIHLGTFPIVDGRVVLTGLDLSGLALVAGALLPLGLGALAAARRRTA